MDKHCNSAFVGTELSFILNNLNINCLVLAGVSTTGSLLFTGLNAVDLGYYVTVLSDCVISFTEEGYQHGMKMIKLHMDVESSSKVIQYWQHPVRSRYKTLFASHYERAKRNVGRYMSLIKIFVKKKNEIGFWNAVKLALKFILAQI